MRLNLMILALIASLALNIVFFLKLAQRSSPEADTNHLPGSATEKTDQIRDRNSVLNEIPDLTMQQKLEIKKILKTYEIELSDYKDQILAKRIDIIDELGNPEFSIENLKTVTTELNQIENQFNLFFVQSIGKMSAVMNTEQRIKLLLKFSRYWFFLKDLGNASGKEQRREDEKQ